MLKINRLSNIQELIVTGGLLLCLASTTVHAEKPQIYQREIFNSNETPDLILPDLKGQDRQLNEWYGKVIIVNFWATWCRTCQIEIPDLVKLYLLYADSGFQVIGIGLDDTRKLKNFVRTIGIPYPILHADPKSHYEVLKQWGNVHGILPFSVVIDRDGRIVYRQSGLFSPAIFNEIVLPLLADKNNQ